METMKYDGLKMFCVPALRAAAIGLGIMAGCALAMSSADAATAPKSAAGYLSTKLPSPDWYGRAGGLTGPQRVEQLGSARTTITTAEGSDVFNRFTDLPGGAPTKVKTPRSMLLEPRA